MKKILVAEDTESNFLLLSIILRKDYEILRAFNGAEAVEICRAEHPDLIYGYKDARNGWFGSY